MYVVFKIDNIIDLFKRHWGLGVEYKTKEEHNEFVEATKEGWCNSFYNNVLCGVVESPLGNQSKRIALIWYPGFLSDFALHSQFSNQKHFSILTLIDGKPLININKPSKILSIINDIFYI